MAACALIACTRPGLVIASGEVKSALLCLPHAIEARQRHATIPLLVFGQIDLAVYLDHRKQNHTCHAVGCIVHVAPTMLMCRRHWSMVPRPLQQQVWATYRPGQCDDMNPSKEWHGAADAAILAVAVKERRV